MRKQNSVLKTGFLSEAGSELGNNDYFAYVELDKYACYVIADGLSDLPESESARLATQTIILAFQEHPSMRKRAIRSYLEAANKALAEAKDTRRLKASVLVVVTDYAKARYGYAGNTRLRLYRDGAVKEQTVDMSLGTDMTKERDQGQDALSRHEERNNLYAYLGQGKGFSPCISGKIKLVNGDILSLYTRGIWENLDGGELDDIFGEAGEEPQESLDLAEDLLLSKQPEKLENYTLAAIFVNKVFLDPNRKRRIKKIVTISVVAAVFVAAAGLIVWLALRIRRERMEELDRHYADTIEYIQDGNFVRAGEECGQALSLAKKMKLKKEIQTISDYQKLIEAVEAADEAFGSGNYEQAQAAYVSARERSRYADRVADEYIEKRLDVITEYLSVFDYIQLGDSLAAQGDYERAEEKYLQAKSLATRTYFEEGRKDALDCLDVLYQSREKAEEEQKQEAVEKAANETGAAQLMAEGDKAFAQGDYSSANAYYAMALEKYQDMGDEDHGQMIQGKMDSSSQKEEENEEKRQQAERYVDEAKACEELGDDLEAKKQYLLAKNLYKELKKDDKVSEISGLLEVLEAAMEQEKAEQESMEAESREAESRAEEESKKAEEEARRLRPEDFGPGVVDR